jgi:protein-S-isoprenylcysteine O-methyltransferase Ste14
LIFSPSIYAVFYWAALYLWAIPEWIGSFTQRRRTRRQEATRADRGSYLLFAISLPLSLAIGFVLPHFAPWANITGHQPLLVTIAALLILFGAAFRWYAIRSLGRYFTRDVAVSGDQPVIQAGPYRLVRHPAYTGTLITMVGVGLGICNWLSLLVVVGVSLAGHLYRVQVEERALSAAIGQPYRDYMRRTKRFIPFIY